MTSSFNLTFFFYVQAFTLLLIGMVVMALGSPIALHQDKQVEDMDMDGSEFLYAAYRPL